MQGNVQDHIHVLSDIDNYALLLMKELFTSTNGISKMC